MRLFCWFGGFGDSWFFLFDFAGCLFRELLFFGCVVVIGGFCFGGYVSFCLFVGWRWLLRSGGWVLFDGLLRGGACIFWGVWWDGLVLGDGVVGGWVDLYCVGGSVI